MFTSKITPHSTESYSAVVLPILIEGKLKYAIKIKIPTVKNGFALSEVPLFYPFKKKNCKAKD